MLPKWFSGTLHFIRSKNLFLQVMKMHGRSLGCCTRIETHFSRPRSLTPLPLNIYERFRCEEVFKKSSYEGRVAQRLVQSYQASQCRCQTRPVVPAQVSQMGSPGLCSLVGEGSCRQVVSENPFLKQQPMP